MDGRGASYILTVGMCLLLCAGCRAHWKGQGQRGSQPQAAARSDSEVASPANQEQGGESAEHVPLSGEPGDTHREQEAEPATAGSAVPERGSVNESYQQRLSRGAIGAHMLMVNGDPITIEDILDPIMADLERSQAAMSPQEYARLVRRVVPAQIWQQINERLVYQEAVNELDERMLELLDAEVDRFIRRRVTAEFGGRQSRFEKHLAELGRSIEDVREQAKRHLLVSDYLRRKFIQQVPEATRAELWRYYQAHLDEFTTPASTELLLIDIPYDAYVADARSRPGSEDWLRSKEQAWQQAEKARAELDSGLPFTAVAKTYSKGIHAAGGGAWGVIGSPGLVGRYRSATEALAGMSSHQHSGVIEGDDAYFIVGTGHVEPTEVTSFEQAQLRIKAALRRERLAAMERKYLDKLRDRANVQRWPEFQLEVLRAVPQPKPPRPNVETTDLEP